MVQDPSCPPPSILTTFRFIPLTIDQTVCRKLEPSDADFVKEASAKPGQTAVHVHVGHTSGTIDEETSSVGIPLTSLRNKLTELVVRDLDMLLYGELSKDDHVNSL